MHHVRPTVVRACCGSKAVSAHARKSVDGPVSGCEACALRLPLRSAARALVTVLVAMATGCCVGGGWCTDRAPRPYDTEFDGIATIVEVTEADGGPLLTFDFQPPSWSAAERQLPVAAAAIAGLPAELAFAPGVRVPLHVSFHLEQICATTPYPARPPSWSYRAGAAP